MRHQFGVIILYPSNFCSWTRFLDSRVLSHVRHVKKIDAQLHYTMRMIAGVINSTPTKWLLVLGYIPAPQLRKKNQFFIIIRFSLKRPLCSSWYWECYQRQMLPQATDLVCRGPGPGRLRSYRCLDSRVFQKWHQYAMHNRKTVMLYLLRET